MPKENKRRGRWAEKAKKRQKVDCADPLTGTNQVPVHQQNDKDLRVDGDAGDDFISFSLPATQDQSKQDDPPFYGLLDQQEQDYYASVNVKLELNDFSSDDDKALFLDAVYRESRGKELKIASSQSCSRYLEKLIRVSSAEQVRSLFGRLVGHFLSLVQHRFASHCCETLFLKAAGSVGMETGIVEGEASEGEAAAASMEQLFLTVLDELEPHLGYLLTEQFASHVVRVLLLVFSGEPLDGVSANSVLGGRKKGKAEGYGVKEEEGPSASRWVPQSFNRALIQMISSSVSSLDTTYIRALATHPTGNPILQLLVRLEILHGGKAIAKDTNSVIHKLLSDESFDEGTETAKFVQGLLYDPTGSRLLETIIQHLPGKMFKKLYGNLLKPKMGAMARNDIAGYVAIRILERLSRENLEAARDEILPETPTLIARGRYNILTALVERCIERQVDLKPMVTALQSVYGEDPTGFLLKMVQMDHTLQSDTSQSPNTSQNDQTTDKGKVVPSIHASLLAQSLLHSPTTSPLIQQSLLSLPTLALITLSKSVPTSHIMQTALAALLTSDSTLQLSFNRKFIPKLYAHIADLATHAAGSHVVDALWHATTGLHFIKERIAAELCNSEAKLRDSRYGRVVWRNWKMDVYLRRRGEWTASARAEGRASEWGAGGGEGEEGEIGEKEQEKPRKSKLEIARERFVKERERETRRNEKGRGGRGERGVVRDGHKSLTKDSVTTNSTAISASA